MTLLIHSMAEFKSIVTPALDLVKPLKIAEIGSEHGGMTTILNQWALANNAHLTSIDPAPSQIFRDWISSADSFTHIPKPSLECIAELQDIDCWFIDGDHNWYTVYNELQLIEANCKRDGKPLFVFLHDVNWPCGRRDSYYAPERIPAAFQHEFDYDHGVTPGNAGMINGGFRGMGSFAFACHEGGAKNGVLTAVEDFCSGNETDLILAVIPAVFGLGVLFRTDQLWSEPLASQILPYHMHPLIAKLEENRLKNYLAVIALQDQMSQEKS